MKQIGDELVVTLEVPVADVKEDYALAGVGALAHHVNRTLMAFEQGPEVLHHRRQVHNLRERPRGQTRNQPRGQARLGCRFDYQRELRGRFHEFHGGLRRGVLRSVNDVAPVNQLGKRARIEAELFLRDGRQPQGARFVVRVVELAATAVLAEVLGIGRSKKRALVMVEPPGHPRRAGVFEVHDRVLVPIEQAFLKGLRGAVRQTRKLEFRTAPRSPLRKACSMGTRTRSWTSNTPALRGRPGGLTTTRARFLLLPMPSTSARTAVAASFTTLTTNRAP